MQWLPVEGVGGKIQPQPRLGLLFEYRRVCPVSNLAGQLRDPLRHRGRLLSPREGGGQPAAGDQIRVPLGAVHDLVSFGQQPLLLRQPRLGGGQCRDLTAQLPSLGQFPLDPQVSSRLLRERRQVTDSQERVADGQAVVEEGERALRVHGHQPQRQLGHLHRHRVDVHPVQAVGDDLATGLDHHRVLVGVQRSVVPRRAVAGGARIPLPYPGFHQPVTQVASGRHQERPRPHGDVRHLQREDLVAGLEAPLVAVGGLQRPRFIHQRLQRPLHHLLGQRAGGVVGAGVLPQCRLGDEQLPGQDHHR